MTIASRFDLAIEWVSQGERVSFTKGICTSEKSTITWVISPLELHPQTQGDRSNGHLQTACLVREPPLQIVLYCFHTLGEGPWDLVGLGDFLSLKSLPLLLQREYFDLEEIAHIALSPKSTLNLPILEAHCGVITEAALHLQCTELDNGEPTSLVQFCLLAFAQMNFHPNSNTCDSSFSLFGSEMIYS